MSRSLKLYLIPVLLLLAVTLPHLEQGEFRRDTVRYGAIGLHMWQDGSLLVPYVNSEKPYFNKPPMALWIHGLFLKIFGAHLFAARLPSILAAVGVLLFSMLSVRNLGTQREAVVSGIILALTYEFFRRTREISLDLWQLFFVMSAVWLVTKAIRRGARVPIILCGIPIGLALLCKPLVALMTLPIFALWLALSGRSRLILWLALGALPLALFVAAPWHLYMYATFGERFTGQYFIQEILERAKRSDQASSIFYYLKENARTYWPWMIPLVYAIYLRARGTRTRARRRDVFLFGAVWVAIWLVALSCFADRKPNYALPLYPMLAWIAAWGLCRVPWPKLKLWYERGFPWLVPATIALFLIAALAPIQFQQPPEKNWIALVKWIESNQIDAAQLQYTEIDSNDVSYIYLKTGRWMKSLKSRPAGDFSQNRHLLIVTKIFGQAKTEIHDQVLFSSGPVHVLKR
jgi:4-amino-4-deoxy-L-arabinose transferase-like glycosyltransferase